MALSLRKLLSVTLCALLVTAVLGRGIAHAEERITIGWTAWDDAVFVTNLATKILEDRMDVQVDAPMADIGIQYQGLAKGDLDVMMMSWLPGTHKDYWAKTRGEVDTLGILYTDAVLGWAVPDYVDPKIQSIDDLKNHADMFGGKIQGIDPGAGLMRLSAEAMKEYGLDEYELVSASDAAMTAALARAVRREEPIVVTTWKPHWMFGKWNLRLLKDPKAVLGKEEHIDIKARPGFYQDHPDVAAFFARMNLPIEMVEASMFKASETSVDQAVDDFIKENPKRIDYWVTGQID